MTESQRWNSRWCWPTKHATRPWNSYVYFRRTFELRGKPRRAHVRVSADARYTLYVNGVRVHQGPARSFPETQSFDTLDLAGHLREGTNTVCAIVHQFGVPTFQTVYRDACGLLVDGHIELANDESIALSTPAEWKCRIARGWRKDVVRFTIQLGFQEHFDADADPADWMSPDYEPTEEAGWKDPESWPAGYHPWLHMEPRGVPLLADHQHNFAAVVAQFRGENARGYKITDNVYHFVCTEDRKRDDDAIENPAAMLETSDAVTTIKPPSDGEFVAAVLDLGQYRTGHFQLDIAQAAGDEIIDTIYAEVLDKKEFVQIVGADPESVGSHVATADRYRCRPGAQTWETFAFRGMKYVALILRNITQPLQIKHVGVRQVHAHVEDIGSFECSDEKLNQIWHVGRETQRNCLFDAFVDCPWREQAMWWGDARVQSRVTAYAFGDSSVLERGIRLMARGQASDGSLHSHPPSDEPHHRLPDFMMTWVGSLWDYYFQTGRSQLLKESLPTLHRLFEFFAKHEVADGLMGNFDGWWVFLDWVPLYKGNYSGVLNMMYLQATRYAAAICEVVGESKAATMYSKRADALTASIVKYFWDDREKCFRDGWDAATKESVEQISQHMNTMAILLGVKRDARLKLAQNVLLKGAKQRKGGKILAASPFFYAYVLEALVEAGCRAEAIGIIREKWGAMIDAGATTFWEMWDVTVESHCHAWSASPVYHLMQQVLGVSPTEPGWKSVRIAPVPEELEFAKGTVPTPHGPIRVEWEKAGEDQLAVRIDIPPGIRAEFVSSLGDSRTLKTGKNEFHT